MQTALAEGFWRVHETCFVLAKDCASSQPERGCVGAPCLPIITLQLTIGHLLYQHGQQCKVQVRWCPTSMNTPNTGSSSVSAPRAAGAPSDRSARAFMAGAGAAPSAAPPCKRGEPSANTPAGWLTAVC